MSQLSLTLLIRKLRSAGFSIGVEQIVAAEDLLLLLASKNELNNSGRLSTRFAPIFCQNLREQQQFYGIFEEWLDEQSPDNLPLIKEPADETSRDELQDWGRFSDPRLWLFSGLLIALLGFLVYTGLFREPVYPLINLNGIVVDSDGSPIPYAEVSLTSVTSDYISADSSGRFEILHQQKEQSATIFAIAPEKEQGILNISLNHPPDTLFTIVLSEARGAVQLPDPLPTSVVELRVVVQHINVLADSLTLAGQPTTFQRYYRSYYRFFQAGAILLPLFFLLGWFLLNLYRRKLVLQRKTAREKPLVERLMIRSAGKQLFRNLTFQRTVREMRKHRELASFNLHEEHTIDATLNSGGLFTPVYGTRQASPEYLVLIDRASFRDHQARFIDTLIEELRGEGVFLDRFYYDSDARYCYPEDVKSNPLHLFELSARYTQHRLIVFGDARGFFNPVNHRLLPWVELFHGWEERVLLTPEKLPGWGFREWNIAAQDFRVFPANRKGLHTFIEAVQQDTIPAIPNDGTYRPFPKLLDSHTLRWLERDPPRSKQLIQLFQQLQGYLGSDGMYWLSACAAYPELNWALTLTFGKSLKTENDAPLLNEDRLLSISRLPWLRYGYMPDWLRIELLAMLTHAQELEIRSTLKNILLSAVDNPGTAPLEIAKSKTDASPKLKGLLRSILQQAEPGTPPRDYVFLSFLSGRQPDQLTPLVPRMLRRFLYRRGYSVLGIRPWFITTLVLCLAGMLSAGLWFFPPEQPERPLVPKFALMENVGDVNAAFSNGVSSNQNEQEKYEYTSLSGPGTSKLDENQTQEIDISNVQSVQQFSPDTKLASAFALSELSFEVFLQNFSTHEELIAEFEPDTAGLKVITDIMFSDDRSAIQDFIDRNLQSSGSGLLGINIRFFLGDVANELLRGYENWLKRKLVESAGTDTTNFRLFLPPVFNGEGIVNDSWDEIPCPPFCPVRITSKRNRNTISGGNASLSMADIFMMWRDRPIYLMVQQSDAVADPPQTRPALELPLRTQSIANYSVEQANAMIQRYDFFDFYANPDGMGVDNQFDRHSTRNGEYIVDNATNLIWLQKSSPRFYQNEITPYLRKANDGRQAGFSDWRIPTLDELMSLVEPVKSGNYYIDPIFQEGNPNIEFVWSSDPSWIFQFWEGYAYPENARDQAVVLLVRSITPIGESNQNTNQVESQEPPQQQQSAPPTNADQGDPEPLVNLRPTGQQNYTMNLYTDFIQRLNLWDQVVNFRGGDFPGDFVREQHMGNQNPANTTGTILYDRMSGLRWQTGGTAAVPFSSAQAHLDELNSSNYGGRSDWRLPTSEEAASLLRAQKDEYGLAIAQGFSGEVPSFWTADVSPENGNFYMQLKNGTLKVDGTGSDVRSVRAVSGPTGVIPATAN